MKFNDKTEKRNLAGGHSHEHENPKEALRMVVVNNLLEPTYYESDEASLDKLVRRFRAAADEDPEFPLKLAAYARKEMHVRTAPQVVLVLAALNADTQPYVREYAHYIIDRVDELSEVLAISNYLRNGAADDFSGSHPSILLTAVSDVIESGKFDEYQFAKYQNTDSAVSLHDVLNVTHPFSEHVDWADKVTKGRKDDHPEVTPLYQRRTWEDRLSSAGEEGDITAEDWLGVLEDMGLFARIRNLRNMLSLGIDSEDILGDVDDSWIRNSRIYPFRFYQARKALTAEGEMNEYVHTWLEHAIDVSVDNVPETLEDTVTLVDLSGSMRSPVSNRSDLARREIATLFGAVLGTRGASVYGFADKVARADDPLKTTVLSLQESINRINVGSSTFAHKALDMAIDERDFRRRVVVFTDMQIWEISRYRNDPNAFRGAWEHYHDSSGIEPYLYLVDLASYGEIKLPSDYPNVHRMSGWNSRVLDYIYHVENSQLEDIENLNFVESLS